MDVLILLDLLGAPDPTISSYYPSTKWLYDALRSAETRLAKAGHLATLGEPNWKADGWSRAKSWFRGGSGGWGAISDDHLPFWHRGVEILHGESIHPISI